MLLVLVTLAISVSLVVILGLLALAETAFVLAPGPAASADRPPSWAAPSRERFEELSAVAQRLTRGLLALRRDAVAARRRDAPRHTCRPVDADFCSTQIGVTVSEALELAGYLLSTQPVQRLEEIRSHASRNAALPADLPAASGRRCPLACADGSCVAAPVMPVQCRIKCELFGHQLAEAAGDRARAQRLARGAAIESSRALAAAAEEPVYELNSALATVLALPDAAAVWSAPDDLLAPCRRMAPPAAN